MRDISEASVYNGAFPSPSFFLSSVCSWSQLESPFVQNTLFQNSTLRSRTACRVPSIHTVRIFVILASCWSSCPCPCSRSCPLARRSPQPRASAPRSVERRQEGQSCSSCRRRGQSRRSQGSIKRRITVCVVSVIMHPVSALLFFPLLMGKGC